MLLLPLLPASAQECEPTTSAPEVDAGSVVYIDIDFTWFSAGTNCDVHVYQEANGITGLQRQDNIVDDTCSGEIAGDTIVL